MSVLHATDTVTVWMEGGRPVRMVWRGRRYQISDEPTQLYGEPADHPMLTHPLWPMVGWRFQGTAVDDPSHVRIFDVHRVEGDRWELVAVYE